MNTYRVFVTRHYIAVTFFDIESDSKKHAKQDARKAAQELFPDSRSMAADNGWIPDDAVDIPALGSSFAPFDVEKVFKTKNSVVYIDKDKLSK